jgi:hypothetical protein
MKIIDGIKIKGTHIEIPDCDRDELPAFFKEMGYKVGAEVGVLRGEYTEKFCQAGLKMYAIDPWTTYVNYRRHSREEPYDVMFENVKARLSPYDCTIIRKKSMDALEDFPDGSLDFVYIDGNHTVRYIVEDIYEWYRKIRVGGIIAGHDYGVNSRGPYSFQALHIKQAVDMMTGVLGIKNWYILGKKYVVKGEKRDKWRSWMWVKE